MSDSAVLNLAGVSKTYQKNTNTVHALNNIDLTLNTGEFVAIQGPSGCGKSTMLLIAGTLLKPDAGEVHIAGTNPYDLSPEARSKFRAGHIGFVFQQFHLIPYLSVKDNILAAACKGLDDTKKARANQLIESLGLVDRVSHTPAELSVGERQRTALARAMLNNPKLILADEPTGNLDDDNSNIVLDQLKQYANAGGVVMMVTHDAQAAAAADKIINMNQGNILSDVKQTVG